MVATVATEVTVPYPASFCAGLIFLWVRPKGRAPPHNSKKFSVPCPSARLDRTIPPTPLPRPGFEPATLPQPSHMMIGGNRTHDSRPPKASTTQHPQRQNRPTPGRVGPCTCPTGARGFPTLPCHSTGPERPGPPAYGPGRRAGCLLRPARRRMCVVAWWGARASSTGPEGPGRWGRFPNDRCISSYARWPSYPDAAVV